MNPTEKACQGCGENTTIENYKRSSKYVDGYAKHCKTFPVCANSGEHLLDAQLDQVNTRRSKLDELRKKLEN